MKKICYTIYPFLYETNELGMRMGILIQIMRLYATKRSKIHIHNHCLLLWKIYIFELFRPFFGLKLRNVLAVNNSSHFQVIQITLIHTYLSVIIKLFNQT